MLQNEKHLNASIRFFTIYEKVKYGITDSLNKMAFYEYFKYIWNCMESPGII